MQNTILWTRYFCTLPLNTKSYIHCLSDFSSGQTVKIDYSAVYLFDSGIYFFRNINATNPKNIIYTGVIHNDNKPDYLSLKFFHIVFQENEGSMAITFSLAPNGLSEAFYGHIENSKAPTRFGIVGFLRGINKMNYMNFINCNGNLAFLDDNASVYFSNCYFNPNIIINVCTNEYYLSKTIHFSSNYICNFELNNPKKSCFHIGNKINNYIIPFIFNFIFIDSKL